MGVAEAAGDPTDDEDGQVEREGLLADQHHFAELLQIDPADEFHGHEIDLLPRGQIAVQIGGAGTQSGVEQT